MVFFFIACQKNDLPEDQVGNLVANIVLSGKPLGEVYALKVY
jgi:hypothetical protein